MVEVPDLIYFSIANVRGSILLGSDKAFVA